MQIMGSVLLNEFKDLVILFHQRWFKLLLLMLVVLLVVDCVGVSLGFNFIATMDIYILLGMFHERFL